MPQIRFESFRIIRQVLIGYCFQPSVHDGITEIIQTPIDALSPPQPENHPVLNRQRKIGIDDRQKLILVFGKFPFHLLEEI